MAVLALPMVLLKSELVPVAVLPSPVVLEKRANAPVAVLPWPVLLKSAPAPMGCRCETKKSNPFEIARDR
jgi:hypothetical protein